MYFILILIVTLFNSDSLISGQTYNNVRSKQDGLSISIMYDMEGSLFRGDKVSLAYSLDDGKNYSIVADAEGDIDQTCFIKNNETLF